LTFSYNILVADARHSAVVTSKGGEVMGLIDVLNGMQNGPRGPRDPSGSGGGGGMSPITMAILGLLAYKAFKSFTGQPGAATSAPSAPGAPAPTQAGEAGGLGDILKGGLGGLLGGGAAGSVLSGGLNDLLKQFQDAGHGEVTKSWVGNGPNKAISPDDLGKALGADQINALSAQSGMSRDDLLESLSQYLPQAIDHLTPNGRVPTDQELSRSL
jgi:uncharacterized protein YidB (DUF937 family)